MKISITPTITPIVEFVITLLIFHYAIAVSRLFLRSWNEQIAKAEGLAKDERTTIVEIMKYNSKLFGF